MKRTFRFWMIGVALGALLAAIPAVAQEQADALRLKVAEAASKDVYAVEKILAEAMATMKLPPGGNPTYEEIRSCGFYPQETRLECAIEIKRPFGYGGPIGSFGSFEYVSFFVDWGAGLQYVGSGIVQVSDNSAGTNFAVYRDFNPPGGPRTSNGGNSTTTTTTGPIVKVRAILSWNTPVTNPNQNPFWGSVFNFAIRLMPIR